jgi:hypothetical protein
MAKLINLGAEVFIRLGFPSDQIAQVKEHLEGVIKLILAVIKSVLA